MVEQADLSRTPDVGPIDGGPRPAPVRLAGISPSRANDFMQCPLLFRFRAVDKLPEPQSAAALKGSLVHAVLEDLFGLPAEERTQGRALDLLGPAWERLEARTPEVVDLFPSPQDLEAWLDSARTLIRSYFGLEYPQALEPEQRELYVETELDSGLKLRGYIDRLDVAPTGEVRVVDYKTGKAPPPAFSEKALFQMKFYALVIYRIRGVLPHTLQLFYLGDQQVLRYRPTMRDIEVTEQKIEAIWEEIRRAAATGEWRPRTSKLCDWCHHRPICPAWGGTPPAAPEVAVV